MSANGDLEIDVYYDALREEVFENWTSAAKLRTWFAPNGCDVTDCEVAAVPGGQWRVAFRTDDGTECIESGEFLEIVVPERLVFTLRHVEPTVTLDTIVTVTFMVDGAGTRMKFVQTGLDTADRRDDQREGWNECFKKLEQHLSRRELHDARGDRTNS